MTEVQRKAERINSHLGSGLKMVYVWFGQGNKRRVVGARVAHSTIYGEHLEVSILGYNPPAWSDVPPDARIELC